MSLAKLVFARACPFAHRAMVALHEKPAAAIKENIELEEVLIYELPDWYKKMNPRETVPGAIIKATGELLPESLIIAQYLDESIEPKNSLLPAGPGAAAQRFQILNVIEKLMGGIWAYLAAVRSSVEDAEKSLANARAKLAEMSQMLDQTSNGHGDFVFGTQFTLADVAIGPFLIRAFPLLKFYCGLDFRREFPRLARHADACLRRPSFALTTAAPEVYIDHYSRYVPEARRSAHKWAYKLYSAAHCPYCQRIKLALGDALLQHNEIRKKENRAMMIEYEEEIIADLNNPPKEFLEKINPDGVVPVLVTPLGEIYTGSGDILSYIDNALPTAATAKLTPADHLRGRVLLDVAGSLGGALYEAFHARKPLLNESDGPLSEDLIWCLKEIERFPNKSQTLGTGPYLFGFHPTSYDYAILPFLNNAEHLYGNRLWAHAPHLRAMLETARADPRIKSCIYTKEDFYKKQ